MPISLFWPPPGYQDLSMPHDCPVKKALSICQSGWRTIWNTLSVFYWLHRGLRIRILVLLHGCYKPGYDYVCNTDSTTAQFYGYLMLLEATQKGKKSKKYIRSGLGIEPITYHIYTNQLSWSSVSMFKQTFSRSFQKSVNTGQTCDKQKGRKENKWKLSPYIPLKSS